jgi:hypothetical protein
MLGDASSMTDNLFYDHSLGEGEKTATRSSLMDDRWVFTEENPRRELQVAAGLAATSRVLSAHNPQLAEEALQVAMTLYDQVQLDQWTTSTQVIALSELLLTTKNEKYLQEILSLQDQIIEQISRCGWAIGHAWPEIKDETFRTAVRDAVAEYQAELVKQQAEDSPYGVPYRPNIWGAGWNIQSFGVDQYFFHKAWPDLCGTDFFLNALNFVLGVHPGENPSSFASGIGSRSVLVAYGVNRADWSFIPGGVASGTALIRPDLPEMKIWPFFWQQTEYVMGGGSTNYMFLVMAADELFKP